MKIHEYQAKQVLARFGVPVPRFKLAETPEQAAEAARDLGTPLVVVKAQVHAGGRGKGRFQGSDLGGIKVVKDGPHAVREVARAMLGSRLVTVQTGPEGALCRRVLVEEGLEIARELYLAAILDRGRAEPLVMASSHGGVEIEEVAAQNPEAILKEWFDIGLGLQAFQARRLGYRLGIEKKAVSKFGKLVQALARAFLETDASLAEVNPLVITRQGEVFALDAKMNFDDNALYRQPEIAAFRDTGEENEAEIEAKKHELSYIKLDGSIGCMVNGAGLAMATMDIIKLHGGEPANFLDVGGGATRERVTAAFKIILTDPNVRAILVNIFGGIMKCDVIANGVIAAAKDMALAVPLVVRLEGTHVEEGKKILRESGLRIEEASDLTDAAKKVVAAAARR
jgi:succinyl-CoA synthetase beta subunit